VKNISPFDTSKLFNAIMKNAPDKTDESVAKTIADINVLSFNLTTLII
jgi:hypothetical protein